VSISLAPSALTSPPTSSLSSATRRIFRAERQWEENLRAFPSGQSPLYHAKLSRNPHRWLAYDKETPNGRRNSRIRLDTQSAVLTFSSTPKERSLSFSKAGPSLSPNSRRRFRKIPTSNQQASSFTYNAYSIDATCRPSRLVNTESPDYEQLDGLGIPSRKIVHRALLPLLAASSPRLLPKTRYRSYYSYPMRRFVQGEPFPSGLSPPDGVQARSVADMPFFPGDPSRRALARTKERKR